MLSLGSASESQPGAPLREEALLDRRHPQVARRARPAALVLVEQPDAAGVALALLDQRLDEDAEEAGDVGLADEQVDGQLDGIALDARHALGAAALVDLARQGVGPRVGAWRCASAGSRPRPPSRRTHTCPSNGSRS